MRKPPFVLVDSNVIIDIAQQDADWVEWSLDALSRAPSASINPIIYTELCYPSTAPDEVDALLAGLSLEYRELPREALFLAAHAFRHYRELGGAKTAPLPEFFIGAHAVALGVPLVTRDVRRYRTFFPGIELISP